MIVKELPCRCVSLDNLLSELMPINIFFHLSWIENIHYTSSCLKANSVVDSVMLAGVTSYFYCWSYGIAIFSLTFRSVLSQLESVEPHADHTTYSSKRLFIFQQWLEPRNLNTTIRLCFNLGSSPFSLRTSNSLFLNVLLPWRQIPKALYNVNCDRPRKRSAYANSGGVFFSSSQR